jgi:hypothetical protein
LKFEETKHALAEVNADNQKGLCNHIKKTDEEYWVKDAILEMKNSHDLQ